MFRNFMLAATALTMGSAAIVATPAAAQRYDRHDGYERGYGDSRYDNGRYDNSRYDNSRYDSGRSGGGYRGYRDDRRYDNDDRRYYRDNRRSRNNRCDAVGGTVIGAIAGGLLGNSIAGRGDRTLGAVLGAGAGALAGRAIDRSDDPRYCRR